MGYFTMWLQLLGFSNVPAAALTALFWGGTALGNFVGGAVGDALVKPLPDWGRQLTCQVAFLQLHTHHRVSDEHKLRLICRFSLSLVHLSWIPPETFIQQYIVVLLPGKGTIEMALKRHAALLLLDLCGHLCLCCLLLQWDHRYAAPFLREHGRTLSVMRVGLVCADEHSNGPAAGRGVDQSVAESGRQPRVDGRPRACVCGHYVHNGHACELAADTQLRHVLGGAPSLTASALHDVKLQSRLQCTDDTVMHSKLDVAMRHCSALCVVWCSVCSVLCLSVFCLFSSSAYSSFQHSRFMLHTTHA